MNEITAMQASACPFSPAAKQWSPWDADFIRDPWPLLAQIQEEQPVFYATEIGYWVVTKHADVRKCLLDNKTYSAEVVAEPMTPLYESTIHKLIASGFGDGPVLANEQPPTHRAHRTRLQRQFEPAKLRELEPFIRRTVSNYIDRFVKSGRADLVTDFIYDIPALVLFKLLDMPEADLPLVKQWAGPVALFAWGRPTEVEQNAMGAALGEYWAYSTKFVEWKKSNLGDDFISDAIRGQLEEGAEEWPDDYLIRLTLNFTFAGHETTTNATGNAVKTLLTNRDSWEALVVDPAKIPGAINECLRFESSIITWRRRALQDVELSGVAIPAGAKLLLYNGAANRDPDVFADPQSFDIARTDANKLLSFGFGPHLCLGQPVAKLQMCIMLEELTRRLPHIELEDQEFTFSPPNTTARGPDHVWVSWDPARNPIAEDRP